MQVAIHKAKGQLSRLLELVESGESVVITRYGLPVVEMIPARKRHGLPFDIARNAPLVPPGDEWWTPLNEEEFTAWVGA